MDNEKFIIPDNYDTSGKIFGILELSILVYSAVVFVVLFFGLTILHLVLPAAAAWAIRIIFATFGFFASIYVYVSHDEFLLIFIKNIIKYRKESKPRRFRREGIDFN